MNTGSKILSRQSILHKVLCLFVSITLVLSLSNIPAYAYAAELAAEDPDIELTESVEAPAVAPAPVVTVSEDPVVPDEAFDTPSEGSEETTTVPDPAPSDEPGPTGQNESEDEGEGADPAVERFGVTYQWSIAPGAEAAPAFEAPLPVDDSSYAVGSGFGLIQAANDYFSGQHIAAFDSNSRYVGYYEFQGWACSGVSINEETVLTMPEGGALITGVWTYHANETHRVTYSYQMKRGSSVALPDALVPPVDDNDYLLGERCLIKDDFEKNYDVYDQYGNTNGRFSFEGWTLNNRAVTEYVTMGDSDLELVGTWKYRNLPVTSHNVVYSWELVEGSTTDRVPSLQLPESVSYVLRSPIDVQGLCYPVQDTVNGYDDYGNVNGVYTFEGWFIDGVPAQECPSLTMGDQDINVVGKWSFASIPVDYNLVHYDWGVLPEAVAAQYAQAPASDLVYNNQRYEVQANAYEDIFTTDEYGNTNGYYRFSGWLLNGNDVSGTHVWLSSDVTFLGEWEFHSIDVPTQQVTFNWGMVDEAVSDRYSLPDSVTGVFNQTVQTNYPAAGAQIVVTDDYGNTTDVYTFSGWMLGEEPAGESIKISNENVNLTGVWGHVCYTVTQQTVTYNWGNADEAVTNRFALPIDNNKYVKGQQFDIVTTPAAGAWFEIEDAYGNLTDRYTFSGWKLDSQEANETAVMGDASVEITGSWQHETFLVEEHSVTYDWGIASNIVLNRYDLPSRIEGLVKGQTFMVDQTCTSDTIINVYDAYGNIYGRYFFSGWSYAGENGSAVGPGQEITIIDSDITLIGQWSYESEMLAIYELTYDWGNIDTSVIDGYTLPEGIEVLYNNQTVEIDSNYFSSIKVLDDYGNVIGEWIFNGWKLDGNLVEDAVVCNDADIHLSADWTYVAHEAPTCTVTYEWTNEPTDLALPSPMTVTKGQTVAVDSNYFAGYSVDDHDQFGNLCGSWVFQGWDMATGPITEDTIVQGNWLYTALTVPTYQVSYSWGTVPAVVKDIYTLPLGLDGLVYNQSFTVDQTSYQNVYEYDDYGNIVGVWMFSGWSVNGQPVSASLTIDNADIVISGSWSYEATDVQRFNVSYSWNTSDPVVINNSVLPQTMTGLVHNQMFITPGSYDDILTYDDYGNQNGSWCFEGWLYDGQMIPAGTELTVNNGSIDLQGIWTYCVIDVPQYTLTYVVDGVPYLKSEVYYPGQPINAPPVMANIEGYVYSGWNSEIPTVMPDHDVLISASYTLRNDLSYAVHFVDEDTNADIAEPIVVSDQQFGSYVSAQALQLNGYLLITEDTQQIKITVANNEIVFTYTKDSLNAALGQTGSGDGIPDKYQVAVMYDTADTSRGQVTGDTLRIITLTNASGAYVQRARYAPGATNVVINPAYGYIFSKWDTDPYDVIQMQGGQVYTYRAVFVEDALLAGNGQNQEFLTDPAEKLSPESQYAALNQGGMNSMSQIKYNALETLTEPYSENTAISDEFGSDNATNEGVYTIEDDTNPLAGSLQGAQQSTNDQLLWILLICALVVLLLFFFLLYKRRKKAHEASCELDLEVQGENNVRKRAQSRGSRTNLPPSSR